MSDSAKRLKELEKIVAKKRGADEFYEYASLLRAEKRLAEAREVLLHGLSAKQEHGAARLLLAQVYYEDGLGEFCIRELIELRKYVKSPALDKLVDAFGEFAHPYLSASQQSSKSSDIQPDETDSEHEARLSAQEDADEDEEDILAEIDIDADFGDILDEIDE